MAGPRFTEEDLFAGRRDLPRARDIDQDDLNDCFFVAPLGALAAQQPQRIKDAVSYDPATGNFTVQLYEDRGGTPTRVAIQVTQDEIKDNLSRGGGSTVDNRGGDSPIWPAVFETAFAKQRDSNPADGLDEGYTKLNFGHTHKAMYALTGDSGELVMASTVTADGSEKTYERMRDALAQGRPVTLSTMPTETKAGARDGLLDAHTYIVEGVEKNRRGEVTVQLRNPLGNNEGIGEGRDSARATISVKLDTLTEAGGLAYLNIGPAPAPTPAHGRTGEAPAPAATPATPTTPAAPAGTGDAQLDRLLAAMSDPAAMRGAMQDLRNSDAGRAFAAEGQQQTRDAVAAPVQTETAAPVIEQAGPRPMRM